MNIFQTLEDSARRYPDKLAVVCGAQRQTYRELLEQVNRLSAGFAAQGFNKGDRIVLIAQNCLEVVCVYYAAMKIGLIYVGLNAMLKRDELNYILRDCAPKTIVVANHLAEVLPEVSAARGISLILLEEGDGPKQALSLPGILKTSINPLPTVRISPQDIAMIGYTSGTTGFPKGASHTHKGIVGCLEIVSAHLDCSKNDVFLAALPLFQLPSFLFSIGLSIAAASTVFIMEKFEPRSFVDLVEKERVTIFCAVPTVLRMLLDEFQLHPFDFSSVRVVPTAGAMLPLSLRRDLEARLGCRIVHGYGSTETGLFISLEDITMPANGVSVGKVLADTRVRLVKDDGTSAAIGEPGEILVASNRLFHTYWNNNEATRQAFVDGWYASGDIGYFDHQGHLTIADRKRDIIIRGGFNVYPAELERVLSQDPRIKEIVVIGVPHHRLGEVPKAYVVHKDGEPLTAQDVIALSYELLAKYKVLEEVEIVTEDYFPRNALGKVLKRALRDGLSSGVTPAE